MGLFDLFRDGFGYLGFIVLKLAEAAAIVQHYPVRTGNDCYKFPSSCSLMKGFLYPSNLAILKQYKALLVLAQLRRIRIWSLLKSILFFALIISCDKPDCVEITYKEKTTDGRYYFHWGKFSNTDHDENSIDLRSGEVTRSEFDDYEVGATYCLD